MDGFIFLGLLTVFLLTLGLTAARQGRPSPLLVFLGTGIISVWYIAT